MKLKILIFMIFSIFNTINISSAQNIQSALDSAIIKLNELYYRNATSCVQYLNLESSAVNCSGVLIHGIEYGQKHAWIPNPNDPRKSVSFSYLRSDIPTTTLYEGSGFIYDQSQPTNNTKNLRFYCFYPFDAASSFENQHPAASYGCGLPTTTYTDKTSLDFASCPQVRITNADQWIATYLDNEHPEFIVPDACSFSPNHISQFLQVIAVQTKTSSPYWNEMITEIWTEQEAMSLPITGFFYLIDDPVGKKTAQSHQEDYCNMYNKFLPVVILDLSKTSSGAFSGILGDQKACN